VDRGGCHEGTGGYPTVAAVHATVDSTRIRRAERQLGATRGEARPPDATPAVAEKPASIVSLGFGPAFKYVESIVERETVQAAHYAAYAARELLV